MTLYYFPTFPVENRYSEEWLMQFITEFKKHDVQYRTILGDGIPEEKERDGMFTSISNSSMWELQQISNFFMSYFNSLKDGDVLFFTDINFPGFVLPFVQLIKTKYPKVKAYGFIHAGSYCNGDIFENTEGKGDFEKSLIKTFDGIFVATLYHMKKFASTSSIYGVQNIYVVGAPFYRSQVKDIEIRPYSERTYDVIHPARIDKQKDVYEFLKIVKENPKVRFLCTSEIPSALDNRPLRFDEFEKMTPQTIFVSATPGPYEYEKSEAIAEQVVRPTGLLDPEIEVRPVATQVDDVMSEINIRAARDERVLVLTLTKRMAEDLTDYLTEHNVRVRYLHSDIDTVERVEIIRDFRLGMFDVLVGINLLREGLDLPEVSLVAILDADKEGFLRSDRSLIQSIGRAARNVRGKAILYADRITGSMERSIAITNQRRAKQQAHNEKMGITPPGIIKKVTDVLESGYDNRHFSKEGRASLKVEEERAEYAAMTPKQLSKVIETLENDMYKHAKNLEFEEAAAVRDKLEEMKRLALGPV